MDVGRWGVGEERKSTPTNLFKFFVSNMHELPGTQHLEKLGAQVPGDGLHKTQRSLDGILRIPDFFQVSKNGYQGLTDLIKL